MRTTRKGQDGLFLALFVVWFFFIFVLIAPSVFDSQVDAVNNGGYLGEVTDFVVTGNGQSCTVETTQGKYGVQESSMGNNYPCGNLEDGKHLYRHTSFMLDSHYHVAERGRR